MVYGDLKDYKKICRQDPKITGITVPEIQSYPQFSFKCHQINHIPVFVLRLMMFRRYELHSFWSRSIYSLFHVQLFYASVTEIESNYKGLHRTYRFDVSKRPIPRSGNRTTINAMQPLLKDTHNCFSIAKWVRYFIHIICLYTRIQFRYLFSLSL